MASRLFNTIALAAFFCLSHNADAFWRMPCGQPFAVARMDPVVSPGQIASHVHAINGASNLDYNVTFEQLRASNCTTCAVQEDKSLYWLPQLYYVGQDGQYTSVGHSGMTVYYLQRGSQPVKAMPEGLRLVAGDSNRRTFDDTDFAQRAIGFSCLSGNGYNKDLRKITNCPYGLRAEIFFPNCWDGVNLDSPDHKSHVVYSGNDGNGKCPASHPVKLVSVFMEQLFSIDPFKGKWWNGTMPPFVLANGDPTGFGLHADLISGWDKNFLQAAIDQCTNNSGRIEDCPLFDIRRDISSKCSAKTPGLQKFTLKTNENIQGPRPTLPGCNPIQYGPERAKPGVCAADGTTPSVLFAQPKAVGLSAAALSPAAVVAAAPVNAAVSGADADDDDDTPAKDIPVPAANAVASAPQARSNGASPVATNPVVFSIKNLAGAGAPAASTMSTATPIDGLLASNPPATGAIAGFAAAAPVSLQTQIKVVTTTVQGVPTAVTTTIFVTMNLADQALATPIAGSVQNVAGAVNVVLAKVSAAADNVAVAGVNALQAVLAVTADTRTTVTIRTTVTANNAATVDLASLASEAIARAQATMSSGPQANFNAVAASLANPAGVWTTLTRTEYETTTLTLSGQTFATQVAYVQLYVLPMSAASLVSELNAPVAAVTEVLASVVLTASVTATATATATGLPARTQTILQTVMQTITVSRGAVSAISTVGGEASSLSTTI